MPDKPVKDIIDEIVQPAVDDRYSSPVEARKKAMDLLARREHTAGELGRKLKAAGFDGEVASAAIAALSAEGLQSDERFVDAFIQSRVSQGKGPQRIRGELRERGVAGAVVDLALEAADVDWRDLAETVRRKKFGREQPADFKDKARQLRFLAYRGFGAAELGGAPDD